MICFNYCPSIAYPYDDIIFSIHSSSSCLYIEYRLWLFPYSLKFLRLKDFVGQRMAMKNFSTNFQVHNRCKAWLEARPRKFYLWKFVFEQNLAKSRNIKFLSSRILGYKVGSGQQVAVYPITLAIHYWAVYMTIYSSSF